MLRQCTSCEKYKALYFFNKKKLGFLGLTSICKECQNIKNKEYHIKNREQHIQYCKQYYQDNKESFYKPYDPEYYQNNREQMLERCKEWRIKNPEQHRENSRKYTLLKFNSEGWHDETDWIFIKKLSGYKCLCCGGVEGELDVKGVVIKLTEDHIIPLSKGGPDWIDNIQPLCQRCNSIKGVKIIDYRSPELTEQILEQLT